MSNELFNLEKNPNVAEAQENEAFDKSLNYEGLSQQEYDARDRDYKIQLKDRRVRWARRILIAIFVYIIAILAIFVAMGALKLQYNPSVMNVFLGTTSVHVIGLAYVVAKWLFPPLNKN